MAVAMAMAMAVAVLLLLLPAASPTPLFLQLQTPPSQTLSSIASLSLWRARLLRNVTTAESPLLSQSLISATLPLSSHSFGGYTLPLSLGTPPQTLPFLLDTASNLNWVPCTPTYTCRNCSSAPPLTFLPRSSSSSRLVGCRNPKCSWIHSPSAISQCLSCNASTSSDCSPLCPAYLIVYGSGSTAGLLLSETLRIPGFPDFNFAVGCSVFSSHQPPSGVAGFGRGPASLPSQLNLTQFSYCLVSRRFDDVPGKAGSVVLGGRSPSPSPFSTTPFVANPPGSPFDVYYYVMLKRVAVDGRKVRIPRQLLVPSLDGNGGTIVDSGSTFTFMKREVFDAIAKAVDVAVAYNRSQAAEASTGLELCLDVGNAEGELRLPNVEMHFKGGAVLEIPVKNAFAIVGETGSVCLMVVAGDGDGGPSVILGGFQQQDYAMVFDLRKGKLGFRRQNCLGTH